MKTYLEAYRERLERNQSNLFDLAKAILKINPAIEIYHHKDEKRLKSGIVFFDGEKINNINFHEVPYRWSGCGFTEFGKSHSGIEGSEMPFSNEDVLTTFKPITSERKSINENFKTKEQYLKWYSFLTKFENQ